jgi:hypothetical protein
MLLLLGQVRVYGGGVGGDGDGGERGEGEEDEETWWEG